MFLQPLFCIVNILVNTHLICFFFSPLFLKYHHFYCWHNDSCHSVFFSFLTVVILTLSILPVYSNMVPCRKYVCYYGNDSVFS